jgi:DNA-binding transcriptional MerR regulator
METAPEGLFSIGDLAERSGVSPDTIRVWERRYGKPRPIRLPSGHRRYDAADLRWLRRIAEAIALGHRPSGLMRASEEELDALVTRPPEESRDGWVDSILELLRHFRGEEIEKRMRGELEGLKTRTFLVRRLEPLLVEVGRRWADGTLDIRHEHLLSDLVEGLLRGHRLALRRRRSSPRVLLAALPEERHSIGLQMAAALLQSVGADPVVLGVETPLEEIARGAREAGADAVAIGVSLACGGIGADRALAALRSLLPPDVRLAAGGAGTRGPGRGPKGVEYLASLDALTAWLRDLKPRVARGIR